MAGTLKGYIGMSESGPWRDALVAADEAATAHEKTFARLRKDYDAYYSAKEDVRPHLDPRLAESVAAIEAGAERVRLTREALFDALPAAFVREAARLGGLPGRDGEPDWVRLMRDLEALRTWRVAHLDGVDVRLPPLLLRAPPRKGEAKPMLDAALDAWGKAAGVKVPDVRARVAELALAGLLPAAAALPHADAPALGQPFDAGTEGRLSALAERDGADALLAEIEAAAETLPPDRFPPPAEALDALRGHSGPRLG